MFPELAFAVVAFAALLAINSWPSTLLLCTIVAILQDPMRKLTPGQPVYFVGLVGVVFAAGWIGAFGARVRLRDTERLPRIHWRRLDDIGPGW
jgi:hypothetical protein